MEAVRILVAHTLVLTRSLSSHIRRRHLTPDVLAHTWQEDDLAIRALRHRLHSLQIPDLHCGCAAEDISRLAHELRRLDLGACSNDLGFSDPLGLRSHGERVLQLVGEDNVLDQHGLDLDAPARGHILDDFADADGDLLSALYNILEDARTNNMAERGLRALDERLAYVADAKGGLVWADKVVRE